MIKIYDINWNFKTILWKELKNISNFSSQENWWNWKLSIDIKYLENQIEFEIWDIVKYFIKWQLVFVWNIIEIEQEENIAFNFYKLNIIWLAHFINNYKVNQNYTDTLFNIITDLVNKYNTERWQNILSVWNIPTTWNININKWEAWYLDYFKELSKKTDFKFFIDLDWRVNFGINGIIHTIIFWNEINSIKTIKTNETLINKNIVNNYRLLLNNKYNYYDIKPLDQIKILNNNKYNWTYKVAKITYNKDTCQIDLENFISFIKELWN